MKYEGAHRGDAGRRGVVVAELDGGGYSPCFLDHKASPIGLIEDKRCPPRPGSQSPWDGTSIQRRGFQLKHDCPNDMQFDTFLHHGSGHTVLQFRPQAAQ